MAGKNKHILKGKECWLPTIYFKNRKTPVIRPQSYIRYRATPGLITGDYKDDLRGLRFFYKPSRDLKMKRVTDCDITIIPKFCETYRNYCNIVIDSYDIKKELV